MEFPSNSNFENKSDAPKEEETKRVSKVVEGGVSRRKKTLGNRFSETFFGGDIEGVVSYVFLEVLVPAAKDALADAISGGIERMLFGENASTHRRRGSRSSGHNGYVNYGGISTKRSSINSRDERKPISRRARETHHFDDIILPERHDVISVLEEMDLMIRTYGQVTVGDLYKMLGEPYAFTDERWGWKTLRGAGSPRRIRNGYLLQLEEPIELD